MRASKHRAVYDSATAEKKDFYHALGFGIARWELVDYCLQKLFARFVTGDLDSVAAAAAYYTAIGFRTRLEMVKSAARVRLSPLNYQKCMKVLDRCDKLSQQRNHLAHFSVSEESDPREDGYRYHLEPILLNPNFNPHYAKALGIRPKVRAAYNLKQMRELSDAYEWIAMHLIALAAFYKLAKIKRPATLPRVRLPSRKRPSRRQGGTRNLRSRNPQ